MSRFNSGLQKTQIVLLAVVMFLLPSWWPQDAMSLDLYGGLVEVNSSLESFGGYVLGAETSFSFISEKVKLGLRAEYVNKGLRGNYTFFYRPTGAPVYQGVGEATIQYLQPSIEIRGTLFQSEVSSVVYFGIGSSQWLTDNFIPLDPDTSPITGLAKQPPAWIGYVGVTLYAKSVLLDVRYSHGHEDDIFFFQEETIQLGVGVSLNVGGNGNREAR